MGIGTSRHAGGGAAGIVRRMARRFGIGSGYRGWDIVWALSVAEVVSWGVLYYAIGALIVPMQRELGWSTAQLTGGFSLATLVAGLVAIPVGRWVDRHGARALMTGGSILGVAMVLAWSRVGGLPAWYAIWFGIGLAMAATLYEPAFATTAAWFRRDRSRAFLLITIFGGFASTIFLPLTGWLELRLGWRETLAALAVILAVVTIPLHGLVLRRRPEDFGLLPDGERPQPRPEGAPAPAPSIEGATLKQAMRDPGFWWLNVAFWLATLVSIAAGVHIIPILTEQGESPAFAAAAAGAIGAAQVLARVIVTLIGDRVPLPIVTSGVFLIQAVSMALLLVGGHVAIVLAVLLLGAGRGAGTLIRADMVGHRYGRAHFGAIAGAVAFAMVSARTIAPVGTGWLADRLGGYDPVIWGLAVIAALSAGAMLLVGPPPEA